ncbi:MAG: energy-coupling factor transporter transmembrane protein EcfT, partial [Ruminococcus sp.]|nr:energy-coupling factor transporter transmembrane protein EcfT [Candidatus Copronaster equi]
MLTFIFPMLLFVLIINGMFAHYGTTILLTLSSEKNITLEAVIYGLVLGVATITIIMWFFCYGEVVTTDKFMCVFGKILPAGALVISMALRFVPMYKNRLHI